MTNIPERRRRTAAVLALACVLAACSSAKAATSPAANDPLPKSGTVDPITLKLATNETADRPGGAVVTQFVAKVKELSNGAITIVPTFDYDTKRAPRTGTPLAWDEGLVQDMRAGVVDVTMVRSGAWDAEGVKEMQALELPGIFRKDAQVNKLASSDVAAQLLDALSPNDAVGLGLYPDNLRHLAMYQSDPLSVAGLKGAKLRVPMQPIVFSWMKAVGAEPLDLDFKGYTTSAQSGELSGSDVSLAIQNIVPSGGSTAATITGNMPLYAKFNVLALSNTAAKQLGEVRTSILRDAAAKVLNEFVASRDTETNLSKTACNQGMGMASAPNDALDELVAAAKPVIDVVAADPVAGPLLAKVKALAGDADPDFTSICAADQLIDPSTLTPDGGTFPNGVYRFTVTAQMIKDAGLPDSECLNNCGTYTWTLKDGNYSWTIDWPVYPPADIKTGECCWNAQQGKYQVKGNLISFEWPWLWNAEKSFVLETRWRINADKSITLDYQRGSLKWERWLKAAITMPTWQRIGDA